MGLGNGSMGIRDRCTGEQMGDKLGEDVGPGDVFQVGRTLARGCSHGHDTGKWEDSMKQRGESCRSSSSLSKWRKGEEILGQTGCSG